MGFHFTRAMFVLSGERPINIGGALLALPRPVRRPLEDGGYRVLDPNDIAGQLTPADISSQDWEECPASIDPQTGAITFDCEESS